MMDRPRHWNWAVAVTIALQLWGLLPAIATAAAPATVVVESIEVNSDSSVDPSFLRAILGLQPNRALTREQLDTIIIGAESRLQALGFYDSIEFAIRKGSAPGQVVLTVNLETSTYYLGSQTEFSRQRNTPGYGAGEKDGVQSNLFGGTRNFLGRGIKLDLDLSYQDIADVTKVTGVKAEGSNGEKGIFATSYIPHSVLLPFVDLGLGAYYAISTSQGAFRSATTENKVDSEGAVATYLLTTGFRQGLFTATGLVARFGIDVESNSASTVLTTGQTTKRKTSSKFWGTATGIQMKFSEKTGLALVESGFKFFADYTRSVAPEVTPPQVNFSAEYTYFPHNRHGFTPQLKMIYNWDTETNLVRYYDASLLYQWTPSSNLVMGVEHGIHDVYGGADPFEVSLFPEKRLRISLDYITANLSLGIAFLYGPEGARSSVGDLSDLTRTDL